MRGRHVRAASAQREKPLGIRASSLARMAWPNTGAAPSVEMPITIVNRSPLVIGISTDGAAPVFGQAIRAKLEALIPRGFARWAEAARTWRPRIQSLGLSFRERRRFWEQFI